MEGENFPLESFVELKSLILEDLSQNVYCLPSSFFYFEQALSLDVVEDLGVDDVQVARWDADAEKTVEPEWKVLILN